MAISSSSSSDSSSDEDNPPVKSSVLLKEEEQSSSDSELEQPAKPISILKTTKVTAPVKNVNSNLSTVQNLLKTANAATKTQFMKKMIAGSNDKMNEILKSRNSKQAKTVPKATTSPAPPAKKLERIGYDNDFSSSSSEEDSDEDKTNKTTPKKVDNASTIKPQIKKSNSDVSDSDSDSDGEETRKKMEEVKKQLQQNKTKKIIPTTSKPDNSSSSDDSDSEPENKPSKTINNLKTTTLQSKTDSDRESSTDDDKMKSLLTQKDSAPNTPKSKNLDSSDSENDLDTTVSEESGENALIKRFIQQNPDCKPADLKGSFDFSKLTEDEEIFTMKIPVSVSPKQLANATFSMIGKTTLTLENEKYVMMGRHNIERPLLLVTHENNMSQLTTVQIKGSFNLNKKIVVKSHEIIPAKLPTTVDFPADLKERHPLFGVDYSKKIKLDDSVQEKFDGMVTAMCEKIRKPKSKKKAKEQNTNTSVNEEVKGDIFNMFEFLKTSFSVKEEVVEEENDKSATRKSKKKKKEKSVTEPEKEIKSPTDFKSPPMKAVADLQTKSGKEAFHSTLMSPSIGKEFNPDESGILSTSTQMSPNSKKLVSANGKKEKKQKKKASASGEELQSSSLKKRKLETDDNSMDDFQSTKPVVKAESLVDDSKNVSKSKKRKKSTKSDK